MKTKARYIVKFKSVVRVDMADFVPECAYMHHWGRASGFLYVRDIPEEYITAIKLAMDADDSIYEFKGYCADGLALEIIRRE